MHELVRQYIEKKKAEDREKFEKAKAQKLIELGIYEREFPADPTNFDHKEYDYCVYDKTSGTYKHFKRVLVEVSDEEYEEILKYENPKVAVASNPVAKALLYIAVSVYVLGFISGFLYIEYAFVSTILVWFSTFVSGTAILGFAEIVKLLHEIKNKIK